MSTVMLSYSLPEEEDDLRAAQEGSRLRAAVHDFAEYLRQKLKHGDLGPLETAIYGDAQEEWFKCLDGEGISLDW